MTINEPKKQKKLGALSSIRGGGVRPEPRGFRCLWSSIGSDTQQVVVIYHLNCAHVCLYRCMWHEKYMYVCMYFYLKQKNKMRVKCWGPVSLDPPPTPLSAFRPALYAPAVAGLRRRRCQQRCFLSADPNNNHKQHAYIICIVLYMGGNKYTYTLYIVYTHMNIYI